MPHQQDDAQHIVRGTSTCPHTELTSLRSRHAWVGAGAASRRHAVGAGPGRNPDFVISSKFRGNRAGRPAIWSAGAQPPAEDDGRPPALGNDRAVTAGICAAMALLVLGWALVSGVLARHNLTGPLLFVIVGYLLGNPAWGPLPLQVEATS